MSRVLFFFFFHYSPTPQIVDDDDFDILFFCSRIKWNLLILFITSCLVNFRGVCSFLVGARPRYRRDIKEKLHVKSVPVYWT